MQSYHELVGSYRSFQFSGTERRKNELRQSYETYKSIVPKEVHGLLIQREMKKEGQLSVLKSLEKMFE